MKPSLVRSIRAAAVIAGVVACDLNNPAAVPEKRTGGGGGSGGGSAGPLDSATASAQGNAMAADFQLLNLFATEAPTLGNGSGCNFSVNAFSCPVATFEGTTITRSYQLFDASGNVQSQYDATTTDSVVVTETGSGPISGPNITGTISQHWLLTLSGLDGAETSREWNGVGFDTTTATVTILGQSYNVTFAARDSVENVFVDIVPDSTAWPASGDFVRNVSAHLTSIGTTLKDSTIVRRMQVNFNGTAIVPLTTPNLSCTLHLDTRVVTCGAL